MEPVLMREETTVRKGCVCGNYDISLWGYCIQTWAILRLASNILAIGFIVFMTLVILALRPMGPYTLPFVIVLVVVLVAMLVDIVCLIVLIVGVFKESLAIIKVFFYYQLYVTAVASSIIIYYCVTVKRDVGGIVVITFGTIYILLDLCMIVIMKSEMEELRDMNRSSNDLSEESEVA